jgi:hypothetical protein
LLEVYEWGKISKNKFKKAPAPMVPSSVNEVPRDLASSPKQSYLSVSIHIFSNNKNHKHRN